MIVDVDEPPIRGSVDCTAQGVIHIKALKLKHPVDDRVVSAFEGIAEFGAV